MTCSVLSNEACVMEVRAGYVIVWGGREKDMFCRKAVMLMHVVEEGWTPISVWEGQGMHWGTGITCLQMFVRWAVTSCSKGR